MSETYQFTWGQVEVIEIAIALSKKILDACDYSHIETKAFDLDTDKIGIRIQIPHNRELNAGRDSIQTNKGEQL